MLEITVGRILRAVLLLVLFAVAAAASAEKIVEIPHYGPVSFPDSMSDEEVRQRGAALANAAYKRAMEGRQERDGSTAGLTSPAQGQSNDIPGYLAEKFGEALPLTLMVFAGFCLVVFYRRGRRQYGLQTMRYWSGLWLVVLQGLLSYYTFGHGAIDIFVVNTLSLATLACLHAFFGLAVTGTDRIRQWRSQQPVLFRRRDIDAAADVLWEQAIVEIKTGDVHHATWARALEETNGVEEQARAAYLRRRVDQLSKAIKN